MKYSPPHSQSGLTIVELMVSMAIGLVLMAAVMQIFLHNKTTYRLESNLSRIQEDAHFLNYYIAHSIRTAGYRTSPAAGSMMPFSTLSEIYPTGTPYISGTNGDGLNNSDSIIIRFQGSGDGLGNPDGTVVDCLNAGVDANDMATNTFSLNDAGQLICRAQNATTASDTTQVLIDNMENLQILLGEDTNNDNVSDRYVPADFSGLDLGSIASIRLGFLLRTAEEVGLLPDTKIYSLLGTTFNPVDDERTRKTFSSTIQLRNVTYGAQ